MNNKPKVLIADDEISCRALMKAVLNSMNCDVVGEAKNGEESLELYRKLKPHLLMLDVNMPLKTGDEVLKEIMRDFPNAFVIMLTSVVDLPTIEKCLSLGAANYIRKDLPLDEMKAIIKETWKTFLQGE
jgi:two-component system, chemotaxis family, chemotaxis protein CheY